MSDLSELERVLPERLHDLTASIGIGNVSRSGVSRRVNERARRRRVRRAVSSGSLLVAVFVGTGALALAAQDRGRSVVTSTTGGEISPAAQLPAPPAGVPGPSSTSSATDVTSEPTMPAGANRTPAAQTANTPTTEAPDPTVAQVPQPSKTSPASRGLPVPGEPSTTGSGSGTATGSSGTPAPSDPNTHVCTTADGRSFVVHVDPAPGATAGSAVSDPCARVASYPTVPPRG